MNELDDIIQVIDRKNSLVIFSDKKVVIKDTWGNQVEWNVNDVSK